MTNNNLYHVVYQVEFQTKAPRAKKIKSEITRNASNELHYTDQLICDEYEVDDYDAIMNDINGRRFFYDLSPITDCLISKAEFVKAIFTKTFELEDENKYLLTELLRNLPRKEAIQYLSDRIKEVEE